MENTIGDEKLWTVPELKKKLGSNYVLRVVRKDVTLTYDMVWEALNGETMDMEKIKQVQAAARLAIAEAEDVIRINNELKAHRGARKARKNLAQKTA